MNYEKRYLSLNNRLIKLRCTPRNYGIDLLRIVSMIMVCLVHVNSHGGISESVEFLSLKYESITLIDLLSICAVDCFAIISGFVGYGHKFKYSKLIYLWIEVVFYQLGITLLFMIINPGSVGIKQIITNCFPVLFCKNWYFASYFCIAFFIPFFNFLIDKLSYRKATVLVIVSIVLFSILPNLPLNRILYGDVFGLSGGYSPLWLAVLYVIGAYIKKYVTSLRKPNRYLAFYFLFSFSTYLYRLVIDFVSKHIFHTHFENIVGYTTPTVLLSAVFLVLFFSSITINNIFAKIITFFAPASFGVLIIHENGWLNPLVFGDLKFLSSLNTIILILSMILIAVLIWLICSLIDRLRILLFKLLRVMSLCEIIEKFARRLLDKTIGFMKRLTIDNT